MYHGAAVMRTKQADQGSHNSTFFVAKRLLAIQVDARHL